jgi:ABC transport system ATP-binding/permease protein
MPLLSLENAQLAYGHVPLLDHADFKIDKGERVGLLGRNGVGKTSLLAVIAGMRQLDDGALWRAPGLRLSFVPQEPPLDDRETVYETVAAGLGALQALLIDYHHVVTQLAHADDDRALQQRLDELTHALDTQDGWRLNSRIESTLQQLELDADAAVGTLSGGWRKRVALARALVAEPDLLVLDEPTNHLDIAAIDWLENFLLDSGRTLLFVTHDRRFLDRVATRIVELDRGVLRDFPGSYAIYRKRKDELLAIEQVRQEKFDKFLAEEEVWIRKGIEARRTRNEGRVRRLDHLREERAARRERIGQVNFNLATGERSGELVAELQNVSKAFGERKVIDDFSVRILRSDRVGLIGPNGIGKTTLLKLLLGEIAPDRGNVRLGTKLSIAYFDQLRARLDDEATLIDTISPGTDFIEIGNEKKHVMSYLGDFLFAPQRARAKVKSLSGGERNRLLLAQLFAQPANVLLLDEPTNDLDLETLELLEALLQEYAGTVLLVSHDREFLNNIVTQVLAFEGDAKVVEYIGDYDDWQRSQQQRAEEQALARSSEQRATKAAAPKERSRVKLSFKETQELNSLPETIAALEQEQADITTRLSDGALYRNAPEQVKALQARFGEIDALLLTLLERWEALEAKQRAAHAG